MKLVWTIVALLVLGGLIVLLQPPADTSVRIAEQAPERPEPAEPSLAPKAAEPAGKGREVKAPDAEAPDAEAPDAKAPDAKALEAAAPVLPTLPPLPPAEPAKQPAVATTPVPSEPVAPAPAAQADPNAAPQKPSAEGPKPSAEVLASGSVFEPEIPAVLHADILPSRFIRLPDGAISVDDAWTVRGKGTAEAPYEVSWEYLSSAQETYVPRLGEKAIPARIAFLSGKHVRISGYLAFPLVAPTASECLVMLNQWDGCCIGVPPTPYDAVEVKLAEELKGWRKHTINFGAIEGVFKVEPYLVENWLVGLYLIEGAKINREL